VNHHRFSIMCFHVMSSPRRKSCQALHTRQQMANSWSERNWNTNPKESSDNAWVGSFSFCSDDCFGHLNTTYANAVIPKRIKSLIIVASLLLFVVISREREARSKVTAKKPRRNAPRKVHTCKFLRFSVPSEKTIALRCLSTYRSHREFLDIFTTPTVIDKLTPMANDPSEHPLRQMTPHLGTLLLARTVLLVQAFTCHVAAEGSSMGCVCLLPTLSSGT
jgi:hypothetical protein